MFNISFGEILFFGIIALIILGPEKLLQTLSSIFVKYRKLKMQIDKIQTDLENELELIELKKMMQVELQKIKDSEAELKQQLNLMQQELEHVQTLHKLYNLFRSIKLWVYQSGIFYYLPSL